MLISETEHKSAGQFSWYAAKDASLKSAVNASRFTAAQNLRAEQVKLGLELVYSCEEVSITNNKTFIRVKVHKGIVRDRKYLRLLEQDWTKEGIEKILTDQGIIYRVAKI